jgi:hypothetical protein
LLKGSARVQQLTFYAGAADGGEFRQAAGAVTQKGLKFRVEDYMI